MSQNVHPDLTAIALDRVEGSDFEKFAQDFLSALEGKKFVALGGVGDGGADGLYESDDQRIFYQFTRQENHRGKIRQTHQRLIDFGRTVKTIYYLTARAISHLDKEEDLLSEELDVRVKIRDRKYIASHINDSLGTINSFNNHLLSYTQFLSNIARSDGSFSSQHVKDPTAFVFLQHEITNRLGNRKLIHSLTDTMILWSLSDTDPDKNKLMSVREISSKIYQSFPWAEKLLKSHLVYRLEILRKKTDSGREVRWYKTQDKYCLPYETRLSISAENAQDESLKLNVIDELKLLASELFDADDGEYEKHAEYCIKVIHNIFERQGLLFSHFISSDDGVQPPLIVSDCIDHILDVEGVEHNKIETYRENMELLLRRVFYHSSPNQRSYLNQLSRTYVLLFSLQADPRIIEYFSNMSSSFKLFLGSDILVKAISERYLNEEDQVARNLLKMAAQTGISLILSECILEEVYTHIQGTCYEFTNHFSQMEPYITREIARQSRKILIRAYFYAKEDEKVRSWKQYVDQFLTYETVHANQGREELRKYLISEFKLKFVKNDELESVCNLEKVKALASDMMLDDSKSNENLAYNTALLVYGVYGLRKKEREVHGVSEFGLKTWWMTNQTRIARHTTEIVKENNAQYIMRPEYILNFIAMSPNCESVRDSFKNIFPSAFGIQLGNRLKNNVFHQVLSDVTKWKGFTHGRITSMMSDLSDRLKSDRLKRYENNVDSQDDW